MATTDGPMHLLALKVMRISRPELASAWQPFYSSSPSFSAHSSASIMSLQGNTPLSGHPKTLRDFTSATEVLMLPASFGAIQLGETFSSCLCINNETKVPIYVLQFRVEMQTVSSKAALYEMDGTNQNLGGGETLEHIVHHEIKELGQHVLACTISYRLPPNARPVPGAGEDPNDPSVQTFRKFYKFAVTNPLSVKTKVHAVKSPTAMLSPTEREKIFLEVHIQNLTQEAIYFERMRLECTDDWDSVDGNTLHVDKETEEPLSLFSRSMALMHPQDMRQYVYTLTPKSTKSPSASPAPGSVIPLGRLDMAWRSSFGEPGRLLTSMLSRRIPMPPAPATQPASAVPPHLKKNLATRPHSSSISSLPSSRPGTPPLGRAGSPAPPHRATSSVAIPTSPQMASTVSVNPLPELDAQLLVHHVPRDTITLEKPFSIAFSVSVSSPIPSDRDGLRRTIALAIQHLKKRKAAPAPMVAAQPAIPESYTPRAPSSGFSTPSSITATFNYALAHQKIATAAPRPPPSDTLVGEQTDNAGFLPPPFFEGSSNEDALKARTVSFVGPSTTYLPHVELNYSREGTDDDTPSRVSFTQDFELSFIGLRRGFSTVGGIRILVVDDQVNPEHEDTDHKTKKVQTLKEYETVAEIWVP